MVVIVDNIQYFRANDHLIREGMKRFETSLVGVAEQANKDAGFEIKEFPKEGYYHETPELGKYFDAVRTLQENYSGNITGAIQKLHDIYTHPAFGLKQGVPTAINPSDVMYPTERPATISPVADPVTVASTPLMPNWSLEGIMNGIDATSLGEGLVGFGYLVDKKDKDENGGWNPLATTMARETTVLSAMKRIARGISLPPEVDWQVSEEIQKAGEQTIEAYNDMLTKFSEGIELYHVTPMNVAKLLDDAPSMLRCVNVNIDLTRKGDKFYHWGIFREGDGFRAKEFWADHIVTTKEFRETNR